MNDCIEADPTTKSDDYSRDTMRTRAEKKTFFFTQKKYFLKPQRKELFSPSKKKKKRNKITGKKKKAEKKEGEHGADTHQEPKTNRHRALPTSIVYWFTPSRGLAHSISRSVWFTMATLGLSESIHL